MDSISQPAGPDEGADVKALSRQVGELRLALAEVLRRLPEAAEMDTWYFDARFPLKTANLYEAEYWDRRVKRWVGPEPVLAVSLPFEAGMRYAVEIQIVDFIRDENRRAFALHLDGLPCAWDGCEGDLYRAEVVAPRSGAILVQFSCPHAVAPNELNPASGDQRRLAFSLAHCQVRRL